MGTICPCGVQVDAFARDQFVQVNGIKESMKVNLKYKADVCVTSLQSSTLSLQVESTTMPQCFCLSFKSNAITNVSCRREGQNCIVTVTGTGRVGYKQFPFIAVFIDQNDSSSRYDTVQSFVIKGLFDQSRAVPVRQGSIVAIGCQSV